MQETLTKPADWSLPYLQRKQVPTKGLEAMSRPCLGAVAYESSMEWRRAPWIEVDMQDTMNLSYTWKGWPIVEGAVGGHF